MSYDPSKIYNWQPETKFELSGEQFAIILNAVRGMLQTPEAAKILMLDRANQAIENMMMKAVEQGTVVEQKPPEKQSEMHVIN